MTFRKGQISFGYTEIDQSNVWPGDAGLKVKFYTTILSKRLCQKPLRNQETLHQSEILGQLLRQDRE